VRREVLSLLTSKNDRDEWPEVIARQGLEPMMRE